MMSNNRRLSGGGGGCRGGDGCRGGGGGCRDGSCCCRGGGVFCFPIVYPSSQVIPFLYFLLNEYEYCDEIVSL